MAQLIGLGLENFRVFKEYTEFDFAPITLLTGANNSGKSSLIKALLLLKDSAEKKNLKTLDFSGEDHQLGDFETVINHESEDQKIGFSFKVDTYPENSFYFICEQKDDILKNITSRQKFLVNQISNNIYFLSKNRIWIINSDRQVNYAEFMSFFEYKSMFDEKKMLSILSSWTRTNVFEFIEDLQDKLTFINDYSIFDSDQTINDYIDEETKQEIMEKYPDYFLVEIKDQEQTFTLLNAPLKLLFNDKLIEKLYNLNTEMIRIKPSTFSQTLNFKYLPAIRATQKRIYESADNLAINQLIQNYHQIEFKEYVNRWLREFGIGNEFHVNNGQIFVKQGAARKVLLADLGFGFTQLITILANIPIFFTEKSSKKQGIRNEGKILILEEPETNLHPNLQSKLADFLVDAARTFDIRFIVETHSEYLIRKLRVLTKRGTINKKDCVIYYFRNPETLQEGEKLVSKIQINHDGFMTDDFGDGFTNEADNLMIELYDLPKRQN